MKTLIKLCWRCLPAVFALICCGGCGKPIQKPDLIGVYVAEYPYGTEQLDLRSDGTYFQKFVAKDKSMNPASTTGQWDLDGDKLKLLDSLVVDDFYGGLSPTFAVKKHGANLLKIEYSSGRIKLRPNVNTDERYVKQ